MHPIEMTFIGILGLPKFLKHYKIGNAGRNLKSLVIAGVEKGYYYEVFLCKLFSAPC